MRVISVNVGLPRQVEDDGDLVATAIYKQPVATRVAVRRLNLDGDQQADLTVHGGPDKAVYLYSVEHYPEWQREFPNLTFDYGQFGENLTVQGLREHEVFIGDRYRMGSAILQVTQPRAPCFKLGIRFGRPRMVKQFLQSGKTGFYCAVLEEGDVGHGDDIALIERFFGSLSIATLVELYRCRHTDPDVLKRAVDLPHLAEPWRAHLAHKLTRVSTSPGKERREPDTQ